MIIRLFLIFFLIASFFDYKSRKVPYFFVGISVLAVFYTKSIILIGISLIFLIINFLKKDSFKFLKFGYIDLNLMLFLIYLGIMQGFNLTFINLVANISSLIMSFIIFKIFKFKNETQYPVLTIMVPVIITNIIFI